MSDYVEKKLAEFIEDYEGDEIDVSGVYGAQSPDLVQVYVSRLLGRGWTFPYGFAWQLWEDHRDVMHAAGFERVTEHFRTGDLAVFDQSHGGGTGTVGVMTGTVTEFGVEVFTQTPGPARRMTLHASSLLGAWRLTAGAECVALAGEYTRTVWNAEEAAKWIRPKVGDVVGNTRIVGIERTDEEIPQPRPVWRQFVDCLTWWKR